MTYLQTLPEYGLKLDFRPKFPFWGGLGRICAFPHWVRSHSLNSLVYQRVLAAAASRTCLKTALRLCRSFVGQGSLSHWLSCASVIVVTGWCDEKFQRRLVWGITLVAFEKCPADNRNRGMCGSIAGHPSAIPLDFARGFGKTGQAFSKSVRRGAPHSWLVPTIKGNPG